MAERSETPPTASDAEALADAFYEGRTPSVRPPVQTHDGAVRRRTTRPLLVTAYALTVVLFGILITGVCVRMLSGGRFPALTLIVMSVGMTIGGVLLFRGRQSGWSITIVSVATAVSSVAGRLFEAEQQGLIPPARSWWGTRWVFLAVVAAALVVPMYRRSLLNWCGLPAQPLRRVFAIWGFILLMTWVMYA